MSQGANTSSLDSPVRSRSIARLILAKRIHCTRGRRTSSRGQDPVHAKKAPSPHEGYRDPNLQPPIPVEAANPPPPTMPGPESITTLRLSTRLDRQRGDRGVLSALCHHDNPLPSSKLHKIPPMVAAAVRSPVSQNSTGLSTVFFNELPVSYRDRVHSGRKATPHELYNNSNSTPDSSVWCFLQSPESSRTPSGCHCGRQPLLQRVVMRPKPMASVTRPTWSTPSSDQYQKSKRHRTDARLLTDWMPARTINPTTCSPPSAYRLRT